ncbi:MAG: hypothetical protein AMXMBFR58_11560 [Phycisphaerae bacterium]|nr:hypothetical protein [Phycisphaerales bacterium]MCK6478218.1 ACT domain-containing protein [Phycisphaerales bacterium]
MPKAVQFSIGLDNTAGTLADLCRLLKKNKINIEAISVSDNTDCGWVRVVATPSAKARAVLAKAKYLVAAQLVMTVQADNRPGELERIAARLAKVGVNINYIYGSTSGDRPSTMVLGVSDVEKALEALE